MGEIPDIEFNRREFMTSAVATGVLASFPAVAREPENKVKSTPTRIRFKTVSANLNVNGQSHLVRLDPRVSLLDFLRENLGLTGTKKGCDHGQCGASTALVNGKRINSCLSLAVQNVDKKITTIEGLAKGQELHPLQAAFIKHDAYQCGFCTPGQIMSATGLLGESGDTSDLRESMSGNICRCGAYRNILTAIDEVRKMEKPPATV